ncbi:MAG TPA: class I SAM-dependent methyltransferase [Pyrinomonadaceae bacterium]|jgi:SAM-dependent methyltransferase|nr:class I SAM-dependent methyltransferase [Pyrinomonadaceae bacterium]
MLNKLANLPRRLHRVFLPGQSTTRNKEEEIITRVGSDESLLFSAIRQNVNRHASALHNILHLYRALNRLLGLVGESAHQKKVVLEMGTAREPGLPLVLLLAGADKYYANNILPIDDWVSEAYAKLSYLMLAGFMPYDPVPLSQVCVNEVDGNGTPIVRLRPEKFVSLSPVPAEEITLPESSVDLIFSFSVLEHVKRPRAVIQNMFRMLKPGGIAVHGIDLRDHTDFSKPLDFLMYSPEDYVLKTQATENRWRASDFLDCFKSEGFEISKHLFRDTTLSLTSTGATDACDSVMEPFDTMLPKSSFETITPWITDEMRARFYHLYQTKSLADLSILTMAVILRKP